MPCDTVYESTEMDLSKLDLNILKSTLEAAKWSVTITSEGITASRRWGSECLEVKRGVSATLTAEDDRLDRVKREILQSYGKAAARATVKKFGFSELSSKTQADGSIKITFNRLR